MTWAWAWVYYFVLWILPLKRPEIKIPPFASFATSAWPHFPPERRVLRVLLFVILKDRQTWKAVGFKEAREYLERPLLPSVAPLSLLLLIPWLQTLSLTALGTLGVV